MWLMNEDIAIGLTMRDYFAANALSGICAFPNLDAILDVEAAVESAYVLANAMMKERTKNGN